MLNILIRLVGMNRNAACKQRWEELAEAVNFNAGELARRCGISIRQLQRDFRRCLGRSPQDWLNEQRIKAAQKPLLAGETVKKVAYDLGFKQPSHFCRQFKSFKSVTPSEFVLVETLSDSGCRSGITTVAVG